jgi:hypothetical protein
MSSKSQQPLLLIDNTKTGDPDVNDGNPTHTNFFTYTSGNFTTITSTAFSDFGTLDGTSQFAPVNTSNGIEFSFTGQHLHLPSFSAFNRLWLFEIGVSATIWFSALNCGDLNTCALSFATDGGALGTLMLAGYPTTDNILGTTGDLPAKDHFLQLFVQNGGIAVDYALVETGSNSAFPDPINTRLFVNHSDPTILYDGRWNASTDGRSINSNTPDNEIFFSFAGM